MGALLMGAVDIDAEDFRVTGPQIADDGSFGIVTVDLPERVVDRLLIDRGWSIEPGQRGLPDAIVPPWGRGRADGGSAFSDDFYVSRGAALARALEIDADMEKRRA